MVDDQGRPFLPARWCRTSRWHASCPTEEIPRLDTTELAADDAIP